MTPRELVDWLRSWECDLCYPSVELNAAADRLEELERRVAELEKERDGLRRDLCKALIDVPHDDDCDAWEFDEEDRERQPCSCGHQQRIDAAKGGGDGQAR